MWWDDAVLYRYFCRFSKFLLYSSKEAYFLHHLLYCFLKSSFSSRVTTMKYLGVEHPNISSSSPLQFVLHQLLDSLIHFRCCFAFHSLLCIWSCLQSALAYWTSATLKGSPSHDSMPLSNHSQTIFNIQILNIAACIL
jgi:hypothetical protein